MESSNTERSSSWLTVFVPISGSRQCSKTVYMHMLLIRRDREFLWDFAVTLLVCLLILDEHTVSGLHLGLRTEQGNTSCFTFFLGFCGWVSKSDINLAFQASVDPDLVTIQLWTTSTWKSLWLTVLSTISPRCVQWECKMSNQNLHCWIPGRSPRQMNLITPQRN